MTDLRALWFSMLLVLPMQVGAASITIDIPNAFANSQRAADLCTFFADRANVDVQPTRKLCLEAVVRKALVDLAVEKARKDIRDDALAQAKAEFDVIHSQWPEVLDIIACGDGEADQGEECDNGNSNSDTIADACRTNCFNASCGDGVIDTGEQCDPPFPTLCDPNCQDIP